MRRKMNRMEAMIVVQIIDSNGGPEVQKWRRFVKFDLKDNF